MQEFDNLICMKLNWEINKLLIFYLWIDEGDHEFNISNLKWEYNTYIILWEREQTKYSFSKNFNIAIEKEKDEYRE